MTEIVDQVFNVIVETVKECGEYGAPGGILYAGMMNVGIDLSTFELMMGRLVKDKRVIKRGQLYFVEVSHGQT